jgi:hypothetical protein
VKEKLLRLQAQVPHPGGQGNMDSTCEENLFTASRACLFIANRTCF